MDPVVGRIVERAATAFRTTIVEADEQARAQLTMALGEGPGVTIDALAALNGSGLPAARYLHRLFHQERLRVSPPRRLARGCRGSSTRVLNVLRSIPREEIVALAEDGALEVTCEFCAETYRFSPADLD